MSRNWNTPCFVLHQEKLESNLKRLQELEEQSGVKILHTLKSFNETTVLATISEAISGFSVASPKELTMALNANAKQIHLYAPAFKASELEMMQSDITTLSLNSLGQWEAFSHLNVSKGLRINPKLHLPIPSHCNPNLERSRLGVDRREFLDAFHQNSVQFRQLKGLHFHALFQSSAQGFIMLLEHIVAHYQEILPQLKWLNFGGGHNFTDLNYDVDAFCKKIDNFRKHYPNIELYFEPGESVTKGCGEFVATVLDIVKIGEHKVAILDTSIETHLLDVAIVNLRLKIKNTQRESTPYYYELAGNSCMQGDYIGEYFFKEELKVGSQVVFEDMLGYSMVKMTEFNGMKKAEFYISQSSTIT